MRKQRRTAISSWIRMARVVQRIQRAEHQHLRQWDLSLAQFDILAQVGAHEGMTQQELADYLLVTKGNISQLLDKMVQAGLLIRTQERGRAYSLSLTEAGKALWHSCVPAHEAFVAKHFAAFSPEELSVLQMLLRKLDRGFHE